MRVFAAFGFSSLSSKFMKHRRKRSQIDSNSSKSYEVNNREEEGRFEVICGIVETFISLISAVDVNSVFDSVRGRLLFWKVWKQGVIPIAFATTFIFWRMLPHKSGYCCILSSISFVSCVSTFKDMPLLWMCTFLWLMLENTLSQKDDISKPLKEEKYFWSPRLVCWTVLNCWSQAEYILLWVLQDNVYRLTLLFVSSHSTGSNYMCFSVTPTEQRWEDTMFPK